jgi:hopene-associated glycosyltransferase HpnB
MADDSMVFEVFSFLALAGWAYLAIGRGGFWRCAERDDDDPRPPPAWPRLAIVIPARDEAAGIDRCLESLFRQDYRGPWSVILVDDNSSDDTAAVAQRTALTCGAQDRLTVVSGRPLPPGWTGKLWALRQGIEAADGFGEAPEYLLLTDADIVYAPPMLSWLVAHAAARADVLTSIMVKLRCDSLAERFLIPGFIFFFQMLYPFAWVNRPELSTAAAAGGCMLVRRNALERAGGIAALRGELIDDCALGRLLKRQGPIWLGLTDRARSLRAFRSVSDIRPMISRSAYAQLRYSPWLLIGVTASMTLTCVAPVLLTLGSSGIPQLLGAIAWGLMAFALRPILRFYGVSRWWGLAMPAIAFVYLAFTLDSAWQHWRGRGGMWKGRAHCPAPGRR